MTETTERGDRNVATEIPDKYLPALTYEDLPEPVPLRKVIGASVIILATAIGSGEFVLWPYITSQIGFVFMWAAMVGFLMQYFINMEIERYTLATGETAITGFTRLWKPWWWLFIIFVLLQNFWPGWATGAATTVSYIFAFEGNQAIVYITVAMLISIGIALTTYPVVYTLVEKLQGAMVIAIMLFAVVAIFVATSASDWGDLATNSVTNAGLPFGREGLGAALLLGALAFAGAGGANNLVQSNYIRDKGLGMGGRMPKVVSPITGEEVAAPSLGYTFPMTDENMRRWDKWWSVANREHFLTFFVIGCSLMIAMSVLVWSTVGSRGIGTDLEFLRTESEVLGNQIAPWFQSFFLFAGMVILFSTSIGIMDYVSRLSASELKISFFSDSQVITESRIYFTLAWTIAISGSLILLAGLEAPLVLLIISASGAGVVMAFYLGLLIRLNTRVLPEPLKLRGWRLWVMWPTWLAFVGLSLYLVYYQIQTNLFGG